MTNEIAFKWVKERQIHYENGAETQELAEAMKIVLDLAFRALEQTSHLTDRPCSVCKYHTENGCSKWSCVFETHEERTGANDGSEKTHECDCISRAYLLDRWFIVFNDDGVGLKVVLKSDVENAPSVTPKPTAGKWIPCSIEKPQNGDRVIVTRHYGGIHYVETGQYEGGDWCGDLDEFKINLSEHSEPIAWMPLPTPYREEEVNATEE